MPSHALPFLCRGSTGAVLCYCHKCDGLMLLLQKAFACVSNAPCVPAQHAPPHATHPGAVHPTAGGTQHRTQLTPPHAAHTTSRACGPLHCAPRAQPSPLCRPRTGVLPLLQVLPYPETAAGRLDEVTLAATAMTCAVLILLGDVGSTEILIAMILVNAGAFVLAMINLDLKALMSRLPRWMQPRPLRSPRLEVYTYEDSICITGRETVSTPCNSMGASSDVLETAKGPNPRDDPVQGQPLWQDGGSDAPSSSNLLKVESLWELSSSGATNSARTGMSGFTGLEPAASESAPRPFASGAGSS